MKKRPEKTEDAGGGGEWAWRWVRDPATGKKIRKRIRRLAISNGYGVVKGPPLRDDDDTEDERPRPWYLALADRLYREGKIDAGVKAELEDLYGGD